VDRVHTSKCAGMASYEREFIEYGEDNLELNDFVDDALQVDEDESEYNQYIFDDLLKYLRLVLLKSILISGCS